MKELMTYRTRGTDGYEIEFKVFTGEKPKHYWLQYNNLMVRVSRHVIYDLANHSKDYPLRTLLSRGSQYLIEGKKIDLSIAQDYMPPQTLFLSMMTPF